MKEFKVTYFFDENHYIRRFIYVESQEKAVELIQKERDESYKYGGKTVFGDAKPPKTKPQNPNNQLELF